MTAVPLFPDLLQRFDPLGDITQGRLNHQSATHLHHLTVDLNNQQGAILAAVLMLPYLAWVLFATFLNYEFMRVNPDGGVQERPSETQRIEL